MPLGRQVNYKLAPNTWRRRSPPSEGNVTAAVCLCLFMCVGSEESRVALLSKLSESLSKELVRHDVHTSYTYTLTHRQTLYTLLQMQAPKCGREAGGTQLRRTRTSRHCLLADNVIMLFAGKCANYGLWAKQSFFHV